MAKHAGGVSRGRSKSGKASRSTTRSAGGISKRVSMPRKPKNLGTPSSSTTRKLPGSNRLRKLGP